jgi:hypothetical protein
LNVQYSTFNSQCSGRIRLIDKLCGYKIGNELCASLWLRVFVVNNSVQLRD